MARSGPPVGKYKGIKCPAKGGKLEKNSCWKGDKALDTTKRCRIQRRLPLSDVKCELCLVKPAVDRHHIDGNPGNNDILNIKCLCRKCHMTLDGRLEIIRKVHGPTKPIMNCYHCGRPWKPTRKGMCHACYEYRRRTGRPRPVGPLDMLMAATIASPQLYGNG